MKLRLVNYNAHLICMNFIKVVRILRSEKFQKTQSGDTGFHVRTELP